MTTKNPVKKKRPPFNNHADLKTKALYFRDYGEPYVPNKNLYQVCCLSGQPIKRGDKCIKAGYYYCLRQAQRLALGLKSAGPSLTSGVDVEIVPSQSEPERVQKHNQLLGKRERMLARRAVASIHEARNILLRAVGGHKPISLNDHDLLMVARDDLNAFVKSQGL